MLGDYEATITQCQTILADLMATVRASGSDHVMHPYERSAVLEALEDADKALDKAFMFLPVGA